MPIELEKTLKDLFEVLGDSEYYCDIIYWMGGIPYSEPFSNENHYALELFREFVHHFPQESIDYQGDTSYLEWRTKVGRFIDEVLGNSLRHGHHDDESITITLNRYIGEKGILYTISDQGQGFDVAETLRKMENRDHSYHSPESYGQGFSMLHRQFSGIVSYNKKGNIAYLLWLPDFYDD